jgi:hypothetical protein
MDFPRAVVAETARSRGNCFRPLHVAANVRCLAGVTTPAVRFLPKDAGTALQGSAFRGIPAEKWDSLARNRVRDQQYIQRKNSNEMW